MKWTVWTIAFMLGICGCIYAQDKPECPTLEVTGPAGITEPGELMRFGLTVSDLTFDKLTFQWTVSAGTITDGQGTRVLKVLAPSKQSETTNVTATVTVSGLPKTCVNSASESGGISYIEGDPYDIYGNLSINDEYARLAGGVSIIRKSCPDCLLVIIKTFPRVGPVETNRIRKLSDFIISRLYFPSSRFRIIPRVSSRAESVIWFVPPGAKMPQ